eukprot:TRINITY_DN25736_c0_g1_i2.p1 TRINITY_DN25736_c0_g1~~TRINITY_DN25736_c0_g1_i2.p1  ORF type:complete len:151 (+),score=22.52 TRINITY_DN25736_c0_g1_i2:120-572(+)
MCIRDRGRAVKMKRYMRQSNGSRPNYYTVCFPKQKESYNYVHPHLYPQSTQKYGKKGGSSNIPSSRNFFAKKEQIAYVKKETAPSESESESNKEEELKLKDISSDEIKLRSEKNVTLSEKAQLLFTFQYCSQPLCPPSQIPLPSFAEKLQ